jgi:hypothetical protein
VAQRHGREEDAAHCARGRGPVWLVDVVDIAVAVCQSSRGGSVFLQFFLFSSRHARGRERWKQMHDIYTI